MLAPFMIFVPFTSKSILNDNQKIDKMCALTNLANARKMASRGKKIFKNEGIRAITFVFVEISNYSP